VMAFLSTLLGAALLVGRFLAPDPGVLHGQGVWPLEPTPVVVHGFDAPDSPWGSGHRGVDLAGTPGQVVRSSLPGRVTYAGPLAGRGVVTVHHGETRTTYEPVASTVAVGDVVAAGAPLGTLALPGSHCFPRACLHWGWLAGATYLDPLDLVGAGRIRLLPLSGLGSVPTAPLAPGRVREPARPEPGAATELPGLLALTRVGALVGRPSGAARW
jgi:murein DD-endopeptidase MepM/ murein hydrolase activator NlpD